MALHTLEGARKYLTAGERTAFLQTANVADRQVRTFCITLAYAGCRLSEALALTAGRVDLAARNVSTTLIQPGLAFRLDLVAWVERC